jgi:hypothetical protein
MEYKFDLIEKVGVDELVVNGVKSVYNIDGGETASEWVRKEIKGKKGIVNYARVHLVIFLMLEITVTIMVLTLLFFHLPLVINQDFQ